MQPAKKYAVITGASSGIGYETAKAFADRGKNLIAAARRRSNLESLKYEILEKHPTLDVVIKTVDLSALEDVYQFYSSLKDFQLETWVNNAGFGNYDSVAHQDLEKIDAMLRLNIEALTIHPRCLFVTIRMFPEHSLSTFPPAVAIPSFLRLLPIVRQSSMLAHLPRGWPGN